MTDKIYQWQMKELKMPFELVESNVPKINDTEVLVKIAGCGVCHTDLSFWHFGVPTKQELPLTLGHEISGEVVIGPAEWLGKKVIIPAVLPCGECELCKRGRGNMCQKQLMPGNDFHGGFSSHIKVPYKNLCVVPDKALEIYSLEQLAVIADAVTTPYQVLKKSELEPGDFVICIGAGGVGIYGALLAKIMGGRVLSIDIDDTKLNIAKENGIDAVLNIKDLNIKEIKDKVKDIAKELGVSRYMWKILEMSGTKAGQELGFALLNFAGTLSVVGFTLEKLELRLSNLMAFDAKIIGTWGCKPELYPEVVEMVSSGKLNISPFVQTFPMSQINEVFSNTLAHKYTKRSVMVADF
ncbi:MAG: 6-hydroxycyclohex-1-ene-1-carbonyl-CoA dehydrogenase [Candidatus Kapabacteria bacterium]|nr:6-hydroxycyclohex-1-ene-1-carbonyl-CoA dehydrogenase [Candidatus Kapabacteria bacterium]